MTEAEAKETAGTLALMAESERAIGSLYRACAKADPERAEVWKRIADSEDHHAKWVESLATMLLGRQGDGFRMGRKFSREAVQAFIDQIRKDEMDVRSGAIKGRVLYMIARGLEAALLEDRYFEFVTTKDEAYLKVVARIVAETREHQALMQAWVTAAGVR